MPRELYSYSLLVGAETRSPAKNVVDMASNEREALSLLDGVVARGGRVRECGRDKLSLAAAAFQAESRSTCAKCSAVGPNWRSGLLCGGCKGARYCSKECQRADWAAHKGTCKRDASVNPRGSEVARKPAALDRSTRAEIARYLREKRGDGEASGAGGADHGGSSATREWTETGHDPSSKV